MHFLHGTQIFSGYGPSFFRALLFDFFNVLAQPTFQCFKVLRRFVKVVLIQIRKFEDILGQIKVISQEQNQIAHKLLIVKNRLFQHIKNNLLRRKIDLRRFCRKLFHNIIRKSMEGADLCRNTKSLINSITQLSNRLVRIGDHNDLSRIYILFLNQILDLCSHRCSFSRTCTSYQQAVVIIGNYCTALFFVQLNIGVDLF